MTIKELHDSLYEKDRPKEPKLFMDNYEANLDLTNQVDMTNLNDYFYAMRLTCDYAILLENSGYFLKGLLYLEEAIERMENFPNYQKTSFLPFPTMSWQSFIKHEHSII